MAASVKQQQQQQHHHMRRQQNNKIYTSQRVQQFTSNESTLIMRFREIVTSPMWETIGPFPRQATPTHRIAHRASQPSLTSSHH